MGDAATKQDRNRLVAAVAGRLRLIQADFADEAEQVRRDYLADEIQRALAGLVPSERQAFLDDLAARFPTWDQQVQVPQATAAAPTLTDAKELKDPSFLVGRLLELAPQLSAQQKEAIVARLREAGLVAAGAMEWPAEVLASVRPKLQLADGETPNAGNVLELAALLAEFAASLDQLIWTTWKTIAPRSQVKRPMQMVRSMGRFACAQRDTPRGQVSQDLERTRQAVAAIISAISQASRVFAHNYAGKYAPAEVESLAALEGGGFFAGKETRCWKKYQELAPGKDAVTFEAAIEAEIKQALADYAESLMKGLGR